MKTKFENLNQLKTQVTEEQPNAKLIAAAPELLDALLKVQKDLEQFSLSPSTEKLINSAINKATQ